MKTRILIFALFLVNLCAFAEFTLGVKAGFNTSLGFKNSWKFESQNVDFKKDLGGGIDLGLMTRIGGNWHAQIEAMYNLQWGKYSLNDIKNEQIFMHSIDVPILLGYKIIGGDKFNWRVMLGPSFRFNLNSKSDETWREQMDFRKAMVGLDLGTGIDLWAFAIDLRYKLIQNNLNFKINGESINRSPVNAFTLSVAWKFLSL